MNLVEIGIAAQLGLGLGAVVAALLDRGPSRSLTAGIFTAATGVAGVVTGVAALTGQTGSMTIPTTLASVELSLAPGPLGGFFVALAGAVGAVAALYGIGYAHGPAASRTAWTALPLFLIGMQTVPMAADAVTFLLAWELMAVASTVLVLAEHRQRAEVATATVWYAAMTHLSFVLLLLGFGVLAADARSLSFSAMAGAAHGSWHASLAFCLLAAGFATKAGIVPMHVWLPRAHPAAPSHVSAVMSAAMVKMGVYGVLLVGLRLLPGGPGWWGLLLLGFGAVSAAYGILQASVASDLKRLLAYSTTENVGLIFLAVGTGLLLRTEGDLGAADAAIGAALLLAASHAAFKTALFLGAGSILHATGERDLDRLGGLGRRMPLTSLGFGVGALGAAALPVTAGFVAEWALLQSLIHGAGPDNRVVAVAMPVGVSVVALTAGLALMTFVKAYGIAFLARPRSEGAEAAHDGSATMSVALLLAAVTVVGLGLFPAVLAEGAARAAGIDGLTAEGLLGLSLPGAGALLDPVALTLLGVVLALPVVVVALLSARRRPRRHVVLAWGCGGVRVSPRMQYTATSYAEPLSRVFADALRPQTDIEVTHAGESRYLVERIQYSQQLDDVVETRAFHPLVSVVDRIGAAARGLQNGSIHRYLGYSFLALVVVLVAVAL